MQPCTYDDTQFTVDRQLLLNVLCNVKNGKSTGNCAYPIDVVKHHKHVQLYDALAMPCEECLSCGLPKVMNSMLVMLLYKHKGSKHYPDNC